MNLADKKILITGGYGFLGEHLVQKLIDIGVPREKIFTPRSKDLDLRYIENCRKAILGCNVVIHTAGVTGDAEFHRVHPAEIFYDNLMMGVKLIEAAREEGVEKFVTIGSVTEYPENAPLPFREENLWLGFPEKIHAPYTVAKKMLLVQAQAYRKQYNFDAIHILLTNMYGPGEKIDGGPIPSLIKRIGEAKKGGDKFIEVWGSGKPTRDFLYVEDAAEGIILATQKYNSAEPLNVGSGREMSIQELVALLSRLMNFSGEIRYDRSKPDGQMRRVLDTTKAEKELGFKARTHLEAGLLATIKHHGY